MIILIAAGMAWGLVYLLLTSPAHFVLALVLLAVIFGWSSAKHGPANR